MLGVMGAMEDEVKALRASLARPATRTVLGCQVTSGQLDGVEVLLVRSGVGKVNAAIATAALVQMGATKVVFTGMAGGIGTGIKQGDVVIATDLVQHDVDVTAMGRKPGELLDEPPSWPTDPELADELALAAIALDATVHRGRIASGDQFIASPKQAKRIVAQFAAVAVEMEGAACAQVAAKLGVPVGVLRWISDTADKQAVSDFPAFCHHIAELDLSILRALVRK
ncbi:MAG: 5'-methylthioadenosine/adenosylhomocysteine nucleosidase [Propionibacteriaceae bacterium]|jgi:adenosylhomocysteine nucleosidase|nr:5'-methylthioadenosine/adenosylhomocysteine nucleosidase [Propionibacteriaceae bacterium]